MANYARERGKYGGVVGAIQIFTSDLPLQGDPLDPNWRQKIPAGFLRCDGKIYDASDYPELAAVFGVGDGCKFKKPSQTLTATQFQVPDVGAKYLSPGLASGTYQSMVLAQNITENSSGNPRVGAEVLVSAQSNTFTIGYSGNFTVVGQSDIALQGNAKFAPPNEDRETGSAFLDAGSFQAHGHNTNAKVLNYTGNHKVGAEGKSGTDLTPFAGNTIVGSGNPTNDAASNHLHSITWPSTTDYSQNYVFQFPTFNVPADNLQTTLTVQTKTIDELPESIQPFILVEYIIKF
tara:strand:- start:2365 stop:3237 length:873 start_codon:yes stop_codon:yes gene_type:complete